MALTRAEKQTIALNNKIQIQTIRLALNNAIRDTDRKDLIDAFELKLETLEDEITSTNDLLSKLESKRKDLRAELTTLGNRLEKINIAHNFVVEGEGDEAEYFRIKRPNPKDIMIELDDPKNLQGKKVDFNQRRGQTSDVPNIGTLRIPIEEYRIPIEKEVYDAFVFENAAIKKLLTDKQAAYQEATEKEATLIQKYATRKDKYGQPDSKSKTGIENLKFKAAILTEQLATENIFLDAYLNNKEQFTGVMYDEDRKQYTPVNYDRLMETTDYGYTPTAFTLDTSRQQADLNKSVEKAQRDPFIVQPKSWWRTFSRGPILDKQKEEFAADFTSGFILLPKGPDGKRITRFDSATQADIDKGLAPDGMNFFRTQQAKETKFVSPGIPNRNFTTRQKFINQMNTQRAMQRQIRPLLNNKNQNMNPSGFNMKRYLDK